MLFFFPLEPGWQALYAVRLYISPPVLPLSSLQPTFSSVVASADFQHDIAGLGSGYGCSCAKERQTRLEGCGEKLPLGHLV